MKTLQFARRNWVLTRMYEEGYIDEESAKIAQAKPLEGY